MAEEVPVVDAVGEAGPADGSQDAAAESLESTEPSGQEIAPEGQAEENASADNAAGSEPLSSAGAEVDGTAATAEGQEASNENQSPEGEGSAAEGGEKADGVEPLAFAIKFPEEKPAGVSAMMISIKNMEKYELKTGDGLKDTVSYKWFKKEEVLEEIQNVGFYSDFNDFKSEIAAYPEEELLVIADPDEIYGQNWMICLSVEARDLLFNIIDAEARRLQELKRLEDEAEAQRLAEEEAKRNVVYKDKPILPRERQSFTSAETQVEIDWFDVKPSRKLICVEVSRKRSEFGAPIKFNDRDAEQNGLVEFRQHKDPNFELKRREQDVALQACASWTAAWIPNSPWARTEEEARTITAKTEIEIPSMADIFSAVPMAVGAAGRRVANVSAFDFCSENLTIEDFLGAREIPRLVEAGTQTAFFRKLNATSQYEFIELSQDERTSIEEEELAVFLKNVLPSVEVALQQNETIDVFANEFHKLRSEEVSGLGNTEDNVLRELKTFTDLVYSNGKTLPCVDWHPRSQNVVAVACVDPLHFDQRVEVSGHERNSFILIWNFADLIHPQLVLKSPHECRCFAFNPDQPHLVAGACATGQVIIWDISHAQDKLRKRKDAGSKSPETADNSLTAVVATEDTGKVAIASDGEVPEEAEEKIDSNASSIEPVEPLMISPIEQSHKRPITHLEWLPANLNVSSSGRVSGDIKYGSTDGIANQFITCASDGLMIIWGPRFGGPGKTEKATAMADPNDPNSGEANRLAEETPWKPIFKTSLFRQGSRPFGITKVALRGRIDALLDMLNRSYDNQRGSSTDLQEGRPIKGMGMVATGTMFSCATEEGDMIYADWQGARLSAKGSPRGNGNDGSNNNENNNAGNKDDAHRLIDDKIIWAATDHFSPCLELQRSPFFPHLILSVSSHSFNIWKEDLAEPIFSAPIFTGASHLTCAAWSPTRPGVIMVGKSDGTLDIWDFVDQSHRPSSTASITAYAITSLSFRTMGPSKTTKRGSRGVSVDATAPRVEQTLRKARVADAIANAPPGDQLQCLALGDATGNLHILDVPRNLRWRMPTEEKLMTKFFERELERVAHVAERKAVRERERESIDLGQVGSPEGTETEIVDENSSEYRKLVLAEERRFQEMAEKLLAPEDLVVATAGTKGQRKAKPGKSPKAKRKVIGDMPATASS